MAISYKKLWKLLIDRDMKWLIDFVNGGDKNGI